MVSFLTKMPMGFSGQVTRDIHGTVIETEIITTSAPNVPTAFGQFVITTSGAVAAFVAGSTVAQITGILVRDYPNEAVSNSFGSPVPVAGQLCNRLRKGYVAMPVQYGTPTIDGVVYIRLSTGGHGGTVGGVEATSDTTFNAAVTGARFTGSLDINGVAEVAYQM